MSKDDLKKMIEISIHAPREGSDRIRAGHIHS